VLATGVPLRDGRLPLRVRIILLKSLQKRLANRLIRITTPKNVLESLVAPIFAEWAFRG
jgi:hypothetical protein